MTCEALELEVERAWVSLSNLYGKKNRTFFLTESGRLLSGWVTQRTSSDLIEVGTYTRAVPLADFRADVFFAFEQTKGRRRA